MKYEPQEVTQSEIQAAIDAGKPCSLYARFEGRWTALKITRRSQVEVLRLDEYFVVIAWLMNVISTNLALKKGVRK